MTPATGIPPFYAMGGVVILWWIWASLTPVKILRYDTVIGAFVAFAFVFAFVFRARTLVLTHVA